MATETLEMVIEHIDPRDEPNVGRVHTFDLIPACGLCRCGAHNASDNPDACPDCTAVIVDSAVL